MEKIFKKFENNPVLGSRELGTCFDVYVTKEDAGYRMDFSFRKYNSCAVSFSLDGINWSEPRITLSPRPEMGWEERVNRNCVLKIGGKYKMWYTGQAREYSFIGYAESDNWLDFTRRDEPIMIPERPHEGESVMNPCVLYEKGKYRMWYAAGETYEPNVLCYAESDDGIVWRKSPINPIFVADTKNKYEQARVGGCQVIKTDDMGYIMAYIGYENIDKAQICLARSDNGITGWQRYEGNPIVSPDKDSWDADACYKPSILFDEKSDSWLLWYNGRREHDEFIGLATLSGRKIFK